MDRFDSIGYCFDRTMSFHFLLIDKSTGFWLFGKMEGTQNDESAFLEFKATLTVSVS